MYVWRRGKVMQRELADYEKFVAQLGCFAAMATAGQ